MPLISRYSRHAFTLVEMSIVLVIIGLLTGGVLAGESLIHASQLRAVTTEIQTYTTAMATFKDKYLALPGDMNNATSFWGFAGTAAAPGCVSNAGIAAITTTGTCDGNGDGIMSGTATAGNTSENFQFWRQLALAGLVTGSYSGLPDPAYPAFPRTALPGYNVPKSKFSNLGYSMENWGTVTAIGGVGWIGNYGNALIVGGRQGTNPTEGLILTPADSWNIDTKQDDGSPALGMIRTFYRQSYPAPAGNQCSTTNVEATAQYNLALSTQVCNMIVITKF